MYAARYWAPRYFAPRYWPEVGLTVFDPVVKDPTLAPITVGYATSIQVGAEVATAAVLPNNGATTAPLGTTGQTTMTMTG